MATSMTFNSLITDLRAYLERGDGTTDPTVYNQLPRLINLAERAITRKLKVIGMEIPVLAQLTPNQFTYGKPNGWRRTVSMNFGASTLVPQNQVYWFPPGTNLTNNTRTPIFPRSYEYCRTYWPDQTQVTQPKFYADYDYQHWLIAPTPNANYPWEIVYYGLPQLLDASNQTNFWANFCPEVLLYRSLLECAPFLKDDARIQTWRAMYEEAAGGVNQEDLERVADRAAVRKED